MKRNRAILTWAIASVALSVASGCATPKTVNGQKVIGTRWVDGKVVYVVEGDKEAMKRGAEQAKEAGKGVVFEPTK